MFARIFSRLLLLVTPFVLAILSVNSLIASGSHPAEPTPIRLTEISGKVQKLSPTEGIIRDIVVGEVIELNEEVLTHQDSSTYIEFVDNWTIRMESLSALTILKQSQMENAFYTQVKFEVGKVDISLSIGSLDVETPSGVVSLKGPARVYLKIRMNSGETWVSCISGNCSLEKEDQIIALSPGQVVTISQTIDPSASAEAASLIFPSPTPAPSKTAISLGEPPAPALADTYRCGPPIDWGIHVIQEGETLEYISQTYQIPIESLQQANCLGNSITVVKGNILFVPNPPPLSIFTLTPTDLPLFDLAQKKVTKTPKPTSTKTSTTTATSTSISSSTNTPVSYPTDPPIPTATNTQVFYPTDTPLPSPTNTSAPNNMFYLDVNNGSDSNPGTIEKPWETMIKAFRSLHAGDTLYIREGVYITEWRSGCFEYSGTAEQPITVSNYPGETVEIRVTSNKGVGWEAFMCWADASDSTPKVDYVRIIGTGGGFLVRGMVGESIETAGIWGAGNCDHWEVAGLTFKDLGYGIFTKKLTYGTIYDYSPDHWYVHDNLVYNYYSESGMQFNGNYNVIEDNEIYKVANVSNQGYGCQMLNLLGHHNIVRGNTISRQGSDYDCLGILFEWDLADESVVEYNTIMDVGFSGDGAVLVAGGDNNVIRYNTIYTTTSNWFSIYPKDSGTGWPCNDAESITPADDPRAPDYPYFYPHDCKSVGNQEYNNTYIAP